MDYFSNTKVEHATPHGSPRGLLISFASLAIYTIIAICFFGEGADLKSSYYGNGTDPLTFVWFLRWWPFAIFHRLNPFYSYYIWYPHGQNLTWLTSISTAALFSLPITLTAGPLVAFNVLTLTSPILAAWTCFLLANELTRHWIASLVGGFFFGFSSYELGQLHAHLNLDMIYLVPLVPLLCIVRLRNGMSSRTFVLLMAAVLLFQLGLSTEILATLCLFGSITWLVFFLSTPLESRTPFWNLAREFFVASALMLVLAAPFFYYIIKGYKDLLPDQLPINLHSADPLNYMFPFISSSTGNLAYAAFANRLTTDGAERGAYLGLPLVLMLVFYFSVSLNARYARGLLIVLVTIVVASLGPVLHLNGVQLKIRLPWMLASRFPLISSALPVRFSMYVSLISGIVVALWLSIPASRGRCVAKYALAGLAAYLLIPLVSANNWTHWPAEAFFTPDNVHQILGKQSNVLILPLGYDGAGMAWQLQSNMAFTQTGGYAGVPPRAELTSMLIAKVRPDLSSSNFVNDFSALCDTHRINFVLLGPGTPALAFNNIQSLGWPETIDQGITVIRVPSQEKLHYSSIGGDFWPDKPLNGWMGRQVRIAVRANASRLTLIGGPRTASILVKGLGSPTVYVIRPRAAQLIHLPPVADITLSTQDVFVPNRLYKNGDRRRLSIQIRWQIDGSP